MHSRRSGRHLVAILAAVAVAGTATLLAQTPSNSPKEHFTALAVNTSNVGPSGAVPVDITIYRWTTPEEREKLLSVFREKGSDGLLKALRDAPVVGGINTPGHISYDLHFAAQEPLPDGGRRITIATDRPIGFWEAANQPRTMDYPFMLIEMHVDKNGKGEGKLAAAAKLTISNDVLVIENYANQPMMLTNVTLQKK
jgi:hypothetical protein